MKNDKKKGYIEEGKLYEEEDSEEDNKESQEIKPFVMVVSTKVTEAGYISEIISSYPINEVGKKFEKVSFI